MTDLTEQRIGGQTVLQGHFLQVRRDQVRLPDGQVSEREYIVHPGAVMIVPLLLDENGVLGVVLERQYRYPVQRTMIEFPAGKLDPGEPALACAQRELREETGYSAKQWARAGCLHMAIGYSDELLEIWFAKDLQLGPRALDAGEFLDVFTAPVAHVQTWCLSGQITDSKTLAGALWLQNMQSGRWTPQWQTVGAAQP